MMTLGQAAAMFNQTVFTDLNGLNPFSAQVLPFNDSTRSGPTSRRRIVEVGPDVVVPDVIVEEATGEVFLRSMPSADFFLGSIIRRKYVILPAEDTFTLNSDEEILSNSPGTTVRGSAHYIRRTVLTDTSDYLGGYSIVLPQSVQMLAGQFAWFDNSYYRAVGDSFIDDIGFTVVDSIKIPSLIQTLLVSVKGTYDPKTETYPTLTPVPTLCLVEDRTKSFINTRQDFEKIVPGDVTISTKKAVGPGDIIGNYTVIASQVQGAVYALHCRRN